jgi:methionyl aminopeptidase
VNTKDINELCGGIAAENDVLCWFKGVYDFPDNVCISLNDVVVHWRVRNGTILKDWDLVTIDFGIKDKVYWVNTDAAFSVIIWWDDKNPEWARLIQINKEALKAWIAKCKAWNTVWDIGSTIQKIVENAGFKIVKDMTGHAVWKKLHEKPYIPNFWKAWKWEKLKTWMVLAIEPIIGQTSWEIINKNDWEWYIKDGSLGSQYEHTILVTKGDPEIII